MATTTWQGQLNFSLISFPIKLCCAARADSISFNQLRNPDLTPVGQQTISKVDQKPVDRAAIVKGYEYEKGKYVVLTEEDIKRCAPASSHTIEIGQFVDRAAVPPLYVEKSYFIAPGEGGQKPYALLLQSLRDTGKVGIAKIVMSQREHIVMIAPGKTGLVLYTLFYPHEVRASDEYNVDLGTVSDTERALGAQLIEGMSADFDLSRHEDAMRANLLKVIEAKKSGAVVVEMPKAEPKQTVSDLNAALAASLAALKKAPAPAATPTPEPAATPAKKSSKKGKAA